MACTAPSGDEAGAVTLVWTAPAATNASVRIENTMSSTRPISAPPAEQVRWNRSGTRAAQICRFGDPAAEAPAVAPECCFQSATFPREFLPWQLAARPNRLD